MTNRPVDAGDAAEIVIGSFGTDSGPIGAQLASVPVAVRAWAAAVNARGGIGGRRLRLITGDDGGDPARALALARRMVEQDHVVAFVGTHASTTMTAVAPYLEQRGVPVIGNSGSPQDDTSRMVFDPQVSSEGGHRAVLTTIVAQSKARHVAFLTCQEADTCKEAETSVRSYAAKLGIDVVYDARVSLAQPDYTAEVLQARNAGADALAVFIDVASAVRIFRSALRQGWHPVFAGGVALNEEAFKTGGSDVEGVLAASATAPYATSPRMAEYRDDVARFAPGGLLGGTGASAFAAGKLFELVVSRIAGPVTSPALVAALLAVHDETLAGIVPPLSFRNASHGDVNLCTVPIKFTNGAFGAPAGEEFTCAR